MNGICPVCNGLTALKASCPGCGRSLDDAGRISDYYGDYSPYRPIDDLKMTNGYLDRALHQCIHVGWCPACRRKYTLAVQEWTGSPRQ